MYVDINAAGCPNTCRHCSADGHLPYGRIYSLDELRTIKNVWGPLTIRFEPTAHPDFPEIYQADIAINHGGWLVTNRFGIARRDDYPEILVKMQAIGINTVAFTLHGLREHHDWFVCRAGAFEDILLATRRLKTTGFSIHWQIFVDSKGAEGVPALVDLALRECGELPWLELPYHRVGGRLWHYEKIRPTLKTIKIYQLHRLITDPSRNSLTQPESLTADAWLEKWMASTDADEFKHPFEPHSWPINISLEDNLSVRITRNRKVYLDPLCSSPIFIGKLSEGKAAIIECIERLPAPRFTHLQPDEVRLSPEEHEQLQPSGFSLRYREITKRI